MGYTLTHAGFMILNHKEFNFLEKLQLAQWEALLWAEVWKIKKNIKLIMNSVSQRVVSCGSLRLGWHEKEKHTPWRGGRTEDTGGICHQEVSVISNYITTVLDRNTRREKEQLIICLESVLILGCSGIEKKHYDMFIVSINILSFVTFFL